MNAQTPGDRPPRADGRADLHFHALPGVDDGPKTMEEAVELARAAVEDGTRTIVATPHMRDSRVEELPGRVSELRARLAADGVDVDVLCGGELDHDDVGRLSDGELATVSVGPPEAPWLLLEAPLWGPYVDELQAAHAELHQRGYGVVLAHPERCPALFDEGWQPLRALAARSVLQVNATSLTGAHGPEMRERALELARSGLRAVVGSDAHRVTRGPGLSAAADALIAAGVDPQTATRLTDTGPVALLREGVATPAV